MEGVLRDGSKLGVSQKPLGYDFLLCFYYPFSDADITEAVHIDPQSVKFFISS